MTAQLSYQSDHFLLIFATLVDGFSIMSRNIKKTLFSSFLYNFFEYKDCHIQFASILTWNRRSALILWSGSSWFISVAISSFVWLGTLIEDTMKIDAAAPATSRSISLKIEMKNMKRFWSYTSIPCSLMIIFWFRWY